MKAILMSIQPYWCGMIAFKNKKGELRKGWFENCEGMKVYIYCTKGMPLFGSTDGETFVKANGKVIGEFVCDKIDRFTAEFNDGTCYESIHRILRGFDGEKVHFHETDNEEYDPSNCELCKLSCLSFDNIKQYIGECAHDKKFCLLHISDLNIYDEPKELSEFGLKRAPQSWQYVEVEDDGI